MNTKRLSVHPNTSEWTLRWCVALALVVVCPVLAGADQAGLSQPALNLLNELTSAARAAWFVYQNSDSGFNHGFPSGWFPGGPVLTKIQLDTACVFDPASANGCTVNTNRLDRVRGTVMRMTFAPLSPLEFVGINIEEPENYGVNPRGVGYDLRGATRVCFDALSLTPPAANFKVQFAVAQRPTPFVSIPAQWTPFCFDLASLGLTSSALSNVHFPFTVVTNGTNAASGGTVLLDNIRFEPVPLSQATAISFPRANEVFGVRPATDVLAGRVKIPPDQVLANLTTSYESAMVILTLLGTGRVQDANSARQIADAFVYAQSHDNQGDPIPVAPDGSSAVHNGMFCGDLPLFNDQRPGPGRKGQVRLSGFSIASNLCGPSHFCLVLDGATGGNNAFVILALTAAYHELHDQRYLDAARTIGNWIHGNLLDTTGTGYGGYYLGYPDEGQAKQLLTGKSIENNADIFRAFTALADISTGLGLSAEADAWNSRARIGGDFVMQMFDPIAGRFYAGTVPSFVPPGPGITPDGPQRGADVINTFDFLDAQTFTTLPLASSPLYRNAIDWRRPIQWMVDHFAVSVTAGGGQFQGFNLVATPTEGPTGVAWEFTGQAVVSMRFVDALYGESRFEATAQFYLDQIRQAQQTAPFTDLRGVVAATMQDGDLLPPYEQCLSTPFQCIAERVGLAATTWAIVADLNINPFLQPPSVVTGIASAINATAATLNGTANPSGTATSGYFEYGLTASYGSTTPSQNLGSGGAVVAIGGGTIIGLTCNTEYHFRATAANAGGAGNGSDETFRTSACPPTVALSVSVNGSPPANQPIDLPAGTTSLWTAAATGGAAAYQYRFWIDSSIGWRMVQDYSSSNTLRWAPAHAGSYTVQVWVRNAGSTSDWDAYAGSDSFVVLPPDAIVVSGLTATPRIPLETGDASTWTASASGGVGALQYQFWLSEPGTGWRILKPWSSVHQVQWTPRVSGSYNMQMWVRSAGSSASYEAWLGSGPFVVASGSLKVVEVIADRTFPVGPGTAVTWTATSAGGDGTAIEYKFWRYNHAAGNWTVVRDYNTSRTWSWTPAAGDVGTYTLQVWARRQGSGVSWEAWGAPESAFQVAAGPLSVALVSDQGNPPDVPANTRIAWRAIVTGATGAVEYRFWRYDGRTGTWSSVQGFSASDSCVWTPAAQDAGLSMWQVWVRVAGSSNDYEAWTGTGPFMIRP